MFEGQGEITIIKTAINQNLGSWDLSGLKNKAMQRMFDYSSMSVENYSQTLIGWATSLSGGIIPKDITLGAEGLQYSSDASGSRVALQQPPYNWRIIGDSPNYITTRTIELYFEGLTPGDVIYQLPIKKIAAGYSVDINFSDGSPLRQVTYDYPNNANKFSVNNPNVTIYISGGFLQFGNGDQDVSNSWPGSANLVAVNAWTGITNFTGAFLNCFRLTGQVPNSLPVGVTDTSHMFRINGGGTAPFLGTGVLETWDMSIVTDSSYMFYGCTNLAANLDLTPGQGNNTNNWSVTNVQDMSYMFFNCSRFIGNGIGYWLTQKAENISHMFERCGSMNINFNPIQAWNTSSVKNMASLFKGCTSIQVTDTNGIYKFNTYSVTDMSSMFYGCTSLSDIVLTPGVNTTKSWDTSFVTDMSNMFYGCVNIESIVGVDLWNTERVVNFRGMFQLSTSNINLGSWNIHSATNMQNMFDNDLSMSATNYSNTLIGWADASNGSFDIPNDITLGAAGVYYLYSCLPAREKLRTFVWTFVDDIFSFQSSIVLQFSNVIPGFTEIQLPIANITYVVNITFSDTTPPITIDPTPPITMNARQSRTMNALLNGSDPTIPTFTVNSANVVITVTGGFTAFSNQNTTSWLGSSYLTGVISWYNINNFDNAFLNCINLVTVPNALPLQSDGTVSVTSTVRMFAMNSLTNYRGTPGVFTGRGMIEYWDTSKITDMTEMFIGSSVDTNLGYWDLSSLLPGLSPNFSYSYMSYTNYTNTLIGWSNPRPGTIIPLNQVIYADNMQFLQAAIDSRVILGGKGWTFQLDTEYLQSTIVLQFTSLDAYFTPIQLPIQQIVGNVVITWTDGGQQTILSGSPNPEAPIYYPTTSIVTVTVTGGFLQFGYGDYTWIGAEFLSIVESWSGITSFAGAFRNSQVSILPYNLPVDFSGNSVTTDTSYMFYSNQKINGFDLVGTNMLKGWDTSRVRNMSRMFAGCSALSVELTPIGSNVWNTSLVTDMESMFSECAAFTGAGLTTWNTRSVRNMQAMFYGCLNLNTRFSASWDTSNVTDMSYMFAMIGAEPPFKPGVVITFNTAFLGYGVPLFNTINVQNMNYMFQGCTGFNQNLSAWKIYSIQGGNMRGFWDYATSLSEQNYLLTLQGFVDAPYVPQGVVFGAYDLPVTNNVAPGTGISFGGIPSSASWSHTYLKTALIQSYGWTIQEHNDYTFSQATVDLSFNIVYRFAVSATNGVGTGPYSALSEPFSLTSGVPEAPTNVRVSQGVARMMMRMAFAAFAALDPEPEQPTSTSVTLSWDEPPDTRGSVVNTYLIEIDPALEYRYINTLSNNTTYVLKIQYGVTYTFQVIAITDLGPSAPSAPSPPFQLTPGKCDPPTSVVASLFYNSR